jgi:hypothetical protein
MDWMSVAGIMGNGLLGASYSGDLNDLIEAGVYQVSNATTGKPTDLSDGVIVMLSSSNVNKIGVQVAFGAGKMFYRYKWFGEWGTWYLVTSTSL